MPKTNNQVSEATKRNWEKLGVNTTEGKLVSRANKRLSTKCITPLEYFDSRLNIKKIESITQKLADKYDDTGRVLFSFCHIHWRMKP